MKPLNEWIDKIFASGDPQRCLFRVDAGRILGLSFGHLSRCLILADEVQKRYHAQCLFLMRDYADGFRFAQGRGRDVIVIPDEIAADPLKESEFILAISASYQPDWYICDLPYADLDTGYFEPLQSKDVRVVFMDDFRFFNPGADVYLNSNVLVEKRLVIENQFPATFLLGPDYFIWDVPLKVVRPSASNHILLTFGGSDPTNLTKKVIVELSQMNGEAFEYQVILGPGYTDTKEISTLMMHSRLNCTLSINPQDIYPYFIDCRAAICAGGRTMYELSYLNKTYLPIATTDLEAEAISAFKQANLIQNGLTEWSPAMFVNQFQAFSALIA